MGMHEASIDLEEQHFAVNASVVLIAWLAINCTSLARILERVAPRKVSDKLGNPQKL